MVHMRGALEIPGLLLLAAVMGGACYTMLFGPAPPAVLFPAATSYGLWYVLQSLSTEAALQQQFGAAMLAGVFGGVVLKAIGPGKSGAKKAK
jgi:hypothetical protein